MQDFLLEVWEEQRKTVVLVTHDIDEAIYLADQTVVMTAHPGRIREVIDVDLPRPRRYEMRSSRRLSNCAITSPRLSGPRRSKGPPVSMRPNTRSHGSVIRNGDWLWNSMTRCELGCAPSPRPKSDVSDFGQLKVPELG